MLALAISLSPLDHYAVWPALALAHNYHKEYFHSISKLYTLLCFVEAKQQNFNSKLPLKHKKKKIGNIKNDQPVIM